MSNKPKMPRWKVWLGNIAILFIGYLAIQAFHSRDIPQGMAPPIQGTLLDGRNISLEQYRGQPVMIYFWATWCNICKLQQGYIDDIARDHAVITIASQSGDTAHIAKSVAQRNITAPVLPDGHNFYQQRFGIKGYPTSLFITPHGEISDVEVGLTSEWGLRLRLWWAGL